MSRLLIVSNRLPVTVHVDEGDVSVVPSAGGLVTALRGPHERHGGLWLGWPGDVSRLGAEQRHSLEEQLEQLGAVPVHLTPDEVSRYYDGFSNGVLWPLFHYLTEKVHLDARRDWESYSEVNERFTEAIVARYRPGDRVWVHDYQLMLVPAMLRRRIPDARIGFFLHIPFPAAEIFRSLPWREQVLRGMLGADVVGFHTTSYRYHFVYSAARVLGLDPDLETLAYEGRKVRLGAYPVSIDVDEFARLARDEEVRAEARRIRERAQGRKIVLGIDRLDYTKGIPRRLLAIERFLEREPELRSRVRFVQLAVPTREKVDAYADFRRVVNELVGRINGSYATLDDVPIHFLHRSMPMSEVVALYLAADVMMVTPLRDGMNLVCKEYVASRIDDTGALVLSEFAGAAAELIEALPVNPYDIDSVAATIKRALVMPPSEQRVRMQALRRRVITHDVHRWSHGFLSDLERARSAAPAVGAVRRRADAPQLNTIASARSAPSLVVMLDYDGTLVPLAAMPELAPPDEELIADLRALAARPRTQVHVVSGRPREDLERWLGELPISLHAEHGFFSRAGPGEPWVALREASLDWKPRVREILQGFVDRTAGSFIEEKVVSIAWHYRSADPELASHMAREVPAKLDEVLRERDLELIPGRKVLEVRLRGVNKGVIVPRVLATVTPEAMVVALGDDRTDEDLFAALPPTALTVHVGGGASSAAFQLPDPAAARRFLRALVA
ncbi:bifunctional alpha,alpha-trehalose-phosphate synthase (UDP-forming)/trehalose-phosphatase [Sorangium sp. So ce1014]|uniref:bifunctional alpha,alpha-trehalose-phosphate synthase (UDP-forming)/trehalose-phosphatase n=1 Tax=Sorangium sp. So ce1014 TaxID=3133326 RepID=UPI003F6271DB